ncbi:MAG: mannosyltransferase [Fibrobacterota bacterium]|nr:mannosyltransferase [Fibrobacterota bacterium]QQS06351.1 MAG: mannosyltransferase [Fibrobacterota bacterium]
MERIPKKIHYFWFGGKELPPLAKSCIESWIRFLPDYEIVRWDETNYDVSQNEFTRIAYAEKKWAFLSDYARLDILRKFGGIYLDVDVQVYRTFDGFLNSEMFLGFMFDCNLSTAVFGAEKENRHIINLLEIYNGIEFPKTANNDLFTFYFCGRFPEFLLCNHRQTVDGVEIFPKEWFEMPVMFRKAGGYSVHHFMGSWWRTENHTDRVKRLAKAGFGTAGYWLIRQISHYRAVKISFHRSRFLKDRQKLSALKIRGNDA